MNLIIKNKKAYFNYEILDVLESGIVLVGSEVKALRNKRVVIKDSFCRFIKHELYLFNTHIGNTETTNKNFSHIIDNPRKLLLKKSELQKLNFKIKKENLSIIPLEIYFNTRNFIKVKIVISKSKTNYDKRHILKQKTLKIEAGRAIKNS